MAIVPSDLCTFCNNEREMIQHLFWAHKGFGMILFYIQKNFFGMNVELNWVNIWLNTAHENVSHWIILCNEIDFIKALEYEQAKKKLKVWKYNKRWNESIQV